MFSKGSHVGRARVCSVEGTVPVPLQALVSHANTSEHENCYALDPVLCDPP